MWITPSSNELVIVGLTSENLILSVISFTSPTSLLHIKAHTVIPVSKYELHTGAAHALFLVSQYIHQFLDTHKAHGFYSGWWCSGSSVVQHLIRRRTSQIQKEEFSHLCPQGTVKSHHLYLQEDGAHVLYIGAIAHARRFQYQLLAHTTGLISCMLTTHHMALLTLYHYLYGTAYRPTQLAQDLARHEGNLEMIFTPSLIARCITHSFTFDETTFYTLLPALGIASYMRKS